MIMMQEMAMARRGAACYADARARGGGHRQPARGGRFAHARVMQIAALAVLFGMASPTPACDSDADCGPGATCIKRERRASGVCYGRAHPEAAPVPPATIAPHAVEGELRERASDWLGDPDAIIRENLPGRESAGTCMVTRDCPEGFECVVAGFEGRCVKL